MRLSPLYDLSSCLPYPVEIPPHKAKLAMKIGGSYRLEGIGGAAWEKAAGEWKLDKDDVMQRICDLARALPEAAISVASSMSEAPSGLLDRLTASVSQRAADRLDEIDT